MNLAKASTRRTILPATLAVAFAAVALSGCLTGEAQAASVALYVKDDITEHYTAVNVTYTRVDVLAQDAEEWVTAFEGERTIELLSLSNSTAKEKLGDLTLEPGTYEGLRIAVSQVVATDHNGTAHNLTVIGDYLQISESFEVSEDGDLAILLDFDLDKSIKPQAGIFKADVASVQRNDRDSDGDGIDDIEDADDDNDGIEDADDVDIDGDNKTDRPDQSHHGYFGLCTAWIASETGREHGNASESTAFARLGDEAANASQTVEEFCDDQPFPGPPDHIPERAQQAREHAMTLRQEACERAAGNATGGPPEDRPQGNRSNQTGPPEGAGGGRPEGAGRADEARGCDPEA